MIIRLTNASKEYEGEPILLNSRHILSVFGVEEVKEVEGQKEITYVTNIYTITQQSWTVEESVKEIYEMINPPKFLDFDPNDITMPDPYTGDDMTDIGGGLSYE